MTSCITKLRYVLQVRVALGGNVLPEGEGVFEPEPLTHYDLFCGPF